MTYCICDRMTKIDLSTGKIDYEPILPISERFLGGRGVNQKILFDTIHPGTHAFDEENIIALGAGLLVGTGAPCANRLSIDSISAFSEGIGSSNIGGYFATELKRAGLDHIFLTGRADSPVYLWIHDGEVELRDASKIWTKTTSETESLIQQELGEKGVHILSIGPAGEALARIACVIGDNGRAAGRCGLGAVMGSKRIKAIAVKGKQKTEVAFQREFHTLIQEYSKKLQKTALAEMAKTHGSIPAIQVYNTCSATPFRNFQDEYLEDSKIKMLTPEKFQGFIDKHISCASCPIGCHNVYKISDGPYSGLVCNKLEANAVWDFGTKLDMPHPAAIMKAQQLCTEYGLDVDGASSVIAWAMECFEAGILTLADTDGLDLRWGADAVVMKLLLKIAHGEGFGKVLGQGVRIASELIGKGSEVFALHIKGQDLIEPIRTLKPWALGISVSARGAAHTRGAAGYITQVVSPENAHTIWGLSPETDPTSYEAAPVVVKYYEAFHAVMDALGLCFFSSNWTSPDALFPKDVSRILSAALGEDLDEETMMFIGERIHNIEKIFNVRHAFFSRKDDYPPTRLMEEPISSGPRKGEILDKDKWDQMLDVYYDSHGWEKVTGWPKKETLLRLGLEEEACVLEEDHKFPE